MKNGSSARIRDGRAITRPHACAREAESERAARFGYQPSSSAIASMRSRVASETPGCPFSAYETAPFETPARSAMSAIVARRPRPSVSRSSGRSYPCKSLNRSIALSGCSQPLAGSRLTPARRAHRDTRAVRRGPGMELLLALLLGWAVNIAALLVIDWLFDDITIGRWGSLLLGAAVLGIANAIVKPILALLTLPLVIITLGLSYFAINVLMLALAEWITPDFSIDGFWTYVWATIVVWLVNWILGAALGALLRDDSDRAVSAET